MSGAALMAFCSLPGHRNDSQCVNYSHYHKLSTNKDQLKEALAAAEQLLLCTATQEKPDPPISELVLTRRAISANLTAFIVIPRAAVLGALAFPQFHHL